MSDPARYERDLDDDGGDGRMSAEGLRLVLADLHRRVTEGVQRTRPTIENGEAQQ